MVKANMMMFLIAVVDIHPHWLYILTSSQNEPFADLHCPDRRMSLGV